mgnify:CR=1 FL=1
MVYLTGKTVTYMKGKKFFVEQLQKSLNKEFHLSLRKLFSEN